MTDYDIGSAFKAIEDELIASMVRNMKDHRAWEDDEGFHWEQWQALQLKALDKYKRQNQKKYGSRFKDINKSIAAAIQEARAEGGMDQEIKILRAIKNGFKGKKSTRDATAEFFHINDRKLDALIKATTQDMQRAETAVLRMANDQYRKVIFNAQVYANSGAGTYEKAVDMATKDFLSAGLNCVEYKNGARHTLADYADMAIRTASKRAYLQGEGEKRQEWGISTVIINKRGNPCPKCLPFVGKVLVDDVWSGGKASDGPYPLMSTAIAAGLYHPRCKDSHTTYFPGISTADDRWTPEEIASVEKVNKQETDRKYAKRQSEKFTRLATYSLDSDNQNGYQKKSEKWEGVAEKLRVEQESDIIKSNKTYLNFEIGEEVNSFFHEDKSFVDWMKSLTSDETYAIESYCGAGYWSLNKFLRKCAGWESIDSDLMCGFRDDLLSAMSRFNLPEPMKVYRYTTWDAIGNGNLQNLSGMKFVDNGFMSTSPAREGAENAEIQGKEILLEILVPKGKGHGMYINELSEFKDKEYEFLLKNGTECKILSVDNEDGKTIIRMEVLD